MRAVCRVGQHTVAFEVSLQHFGIIGFFLPAALEGEGQRELRKKLLAGIGHIFGDTGAVFRPPAADLLGQRDKFEIPWTQLRVAAHLAQRGIALLEQPLQVAPGVEESGFVVEASPIEERSSVFGAAVE